MEQNPYPKGDSGSLAKKFLGFWESENSLPPLEHSEPPEFSQTTHIIFQINFIIVLPYFKRPLLLSVSDYNFIRINHIT
jgi:hypothetical protein